MTARTRVDPKRARLAMAGALTVVATGALGARGSPAADSPQDPQSAALVQFEDYIYGATLGLGWAGFPAVLATDYTATGPYEHLDVTLPIYLEYEIVVRYGACGVCPAPPTLTELTPPRPLGGEPWFLGHHDEFFLYEQVPQDVSDTEYHTCSAGRGAELPPPGPDAPAGLTSDGRLRIKDTHGGIGTSSSMLLLSLREAPILRRYRIVLGWDKVQTYTDVETQRFVAALPGRPVVQSRLLWGTRIDCFGGQYCGPYAIWYRMMPVHWVSADIAGVSPGIVDEYDLAEVIRHLGRPVDWGFDPPAGGGSGSRNYHVNVAPFGRSADGIDASDLSSMAADLGKSCRLSGAEASEAAAILAWFGIAATNASLAVGPDQGTVPEQRIVDWAKARRALADPSGFRHLPPGAGAESVPWSRVKRLYR